MTAARRKAEEGAEEYKNGDNVEIKILKKSDRKMKFVVDGIRYGMANALRRTMINEIPTMSIESVDFEENSSGLFDEITAHRLGLIPLMFDKKLYILKESCSCNGKGCSRCEAVLVLERSGPCTVKAGDFKSANTDVKVFDNEIPIVTLLEGQRLKLEATAQLGIGKNHSKWQAAIAGYQNTPSVSINSEKASLEIVDVCPAHVFEKKDGKPKVVNQIGCTLCMKCTEVSEGVTVSANEDSFIFDVESVSGLSPEEIVNSALDSLEARTEDFIKEAKKI